MSFAKICSVPQECAMNGVIYARFSSDRQKENSIDFQLRADREYCERKGIKIVGEYIDRAMTGTNDDRPEFQRMIRDAKSQQFAFIIVYRFDRFARNRYDSAIYKKQLESNGVRVLSTEESVGTGDEGIILEAIYEAMAESYSRRLSRVVTNGMKETARKGLSTGGNISYGYKIEDHKLTIDETAVPVVRLVFELYKQGKTKTEIASELNSRGYHTSKHNSFNINNITRILTNRMYIGENSYMDINLSCPAIIERDLFEDVQKLVEANKRSYGKKISKTYFALSGKLFCGECGAAMIGDEGTSKSGNTYFYYSCSNKKRKRSCKKKSEKKDFIEWYVCEQTVKFVLTPENLHTIAEKVVDLSERENGSDELKATEKQLAAIEREFDSLADKLIATENAALIRKINERAAALEQQKASLESQISELQARSELRLTVPEVESYLNTFRTGDLLDEDFRRRLINTLVNCIYLFDDKIVIYFNVRGFDSVNYIDVLADVDQLSESLPECSDSFAVGSPTKKRLLSDRQKTFF